VTAAAVDCTQTPLLPLPDAPDYTSDKPGVRAVLRHGARAGLRGCRAGATGAGDAPVPARTVVVSSQQQQLIGVRVAPVEMSGGTEHLRLYGRVTPEEARVHKLTVGLDGYVRDVAPVSTGSQVRKDQWLASFSTPESRQPIGAYVQSLDVLDREVKMGSSPQQIAAAVSNSASRWTVC
jgi:hypothetical protein